MPRKKKVVIEEEADGEDDLIGTVTDAEVAPVCPIDGGVYGDKAEEVVDWWFDNHPELAAAKYARRKTHRN